MTDSRLDRLERLNRLRESGALTQEEFEREKLLLDQPSPEPVSTVRSGGGSKALLLGSIAALAVVVVAAGVFALQNRRPAVVREAPPQEVVAKAPAEMPVAVEGETPPVVDADLTEDATSPTRERGGTEASEPNLAGGFYDYRTRIREGWRGRPNLAGEFVVIRWGCGTGCTTGVVGNKRTGELQWLELGGEDYPYLQLRFDAGGNDVLATWQEEPYLCASQMFTWNGRRMVAQEQPGLRKTANEDCSE